MSKTFSIKEVIKKSWEALKNNFVVFIVLTLILSITSMLGNIFSGKPYFIVFIAGILIYLISVYFTFSFIKASFAALEGKKVSFNVLKNDMNLSLFFKFFLVYLILSIIFILAAILFIFPVFLAFAVFFPAIYIAAIKTELKIIDIFKKSWEITTKDFGTCLLFTLACFGLIILGMLTIIGIFIVIPLILIACAEATKQLFGAATEESKNPNASIETVASDEVADTPAIKESSADTVKNDIIKEE